MKSVEQLDRAIGGLIAEFEIKQDLNFDFFIGDNPICVAVFGDYSFNISEIYYDLKVKQPKGRILEYYDFCIELHYENEKLKKKDKKTIPNYESYCMGIDETKYYKGFKK